MRDTLIMAGNYQQALQHAKSLGLEHWMFLDRVEKVKGGDMSKTLILKTGTYQLHPNYHEINNELLARNSSK